MLWPAKGLIRWIGLSIEPLSQPTWPGERGRDGSGDHPGGKRFLALKGPPMASKQRNGVHIPHDDHIVRQGDGVEDAVDVRGEGANAGRPEQEVKTELAVGLGKGAGDRLSHDDLIWQAIGEGVSRGQIRRGPGVFRGC